MVGGKREDLPTKARKILNPGGLISLGADRGTNDTANDRWRSSQFCEGPPTVLRLWQTKCSWLLSIHMFYADLFLLEIV